MADDADLAVSDSAGYKAPDKVGLGDLVNKDAEDDSLRRYKEQLLGAAASGQVQSDSSDPRKVILVEVRIICPDRPGGDIVYGNLDTDKGLAYLKENPFVLKEGCRYKTKISFRVQHDIVSGLQYVYSVSRMGMTGLRQQEMLGSYGPQADPHACEIPRRTFDEAPSGMMMRGKYTAKALFTDDDKVEHIKFDYKFEIKKDCADLFLRAVYFKR